MEIHASTHGSYETYRRFYFFSTFEGKHYRLVRNSFILGVSCMLIATCIDLFSITSDFRFEFISLLRFLGFSSMFTVIFIIPKIMYKRGAILFDSPIDFTFYEDEFLVINNSPNHPGTSTIKYGQLYKAYETDEGFYLYLDKKTVYPVEKGSISPEEIAELRTRLISLLGSEKYIKCR